MANEPIPSTSYSRTRVLLCTVSTVCVLTAIALAVFTGMRWKQLVTWKRGVVVAFSATSALLALGIFVRVWKKAPLKNVNEINPRAIFERLSPLLANREGYRARIRHFSTHFDLELDETQKYLLIRGPEQVFTSIQRDGKVSQDHFLLETLWMHLDLIHFFLNPIEQPNRGFLLCEAASRAYSKEMLPDHWMREDGYLRFTPDRDIGIRETSPDGTVTKIFHPRFRMHEATPEISFNKERWIHGEDRPPVQDGGGHFPFRVSGAGNLIFRGSGNQEHSFRGIDQSGRSLWGGGFPETTLTLLDASLAFLLSVSHIGRN